MGRCGPDERVRPSERFPSVTEITSASDVRHTIYFGNLPKLQQFCVRLITPCHLSVTGITLPGDSIHGILQRRLAS
jgi:hypothetical protein